MRATGRGPGQAPGRAAVEDGGGPAGDLAGKLGVLGLSPREAQVYLALRLGGPARASDLATALGMNRTSAYHVLRQLARRGFVSATFARPSRFTASPLDGLIEAKAQEWRQALERADALRKELAQLAPAKGRDDGAAANRFQVVQGRRDALALAERVLHGAAREVRAVSTHAPGLGAPEAGGAWGALAGCAERRVPLRALLRPSAGMDAALRAHAPLRAHVRPLEGERPVQFVLVDERELLLWVAIDPAGGAGAEHDAAIWTNAPAFVAALAAGFDALWGASERGRRMPPA